MSTFVIEDFDTAVEAAIAEFTQTENFTCTLSENATLSIKLKGGQWDGAVDYKVSEFIIKIQKTILNVYNQSEPSPIRYNSKAMDDICPRITVTIENGCSLFEVNLGELWKKMSPKQQLFAIICTVLLLSSAYVVPQIVNNYKENNTKIAIANIEAKKAIELKAQERINEENIRKEFLEIMNRSYSFVENNNYMAFLASKLNSEDIMSINGTELNEKIAKATFKGRTRSSDIESRRYFIDDEYIVSGVDFEKDEAIVKFSDKKRKISLAWLDEEKRKELYVLCAKKSDDEMTPIKLQITADFQAGVFQYGFIHGIGEKRDGSMSFDNASLDSARKQENEEENE